MDASFIKKFVDLLSSYLNQEEVSFSFDEEEAKELYEFSSFHSLRALVYQALVHTKSKISEEALHRFENAYFANIRKQAVFAKEREGLYVYLNEKGIDYLPLKGLILQDCYLDPAEREFADNDILFKGDDSLVKDYFVSKGYEVESFRRGNHDVYWKKPFLNFEMHRSLFVDDDENKVPHDYFLNILDKAPILKDKEHVLSDEDFYLYFLAHAEKHIRHGGCGIRTLVDAYLYLRNKDLNEAYILEETKKLEMEDFHRCFSSLSKKIFVHESLNEEEKALWSLILTSGTYGTIDHAVEEGVKKKGKFGYFWQRLFPPIRFYKDYYPWAYKTKILIPVAWVFRLFRGIFKSGKRTRSELKALSKTKK